MKKITLLTIIAVFFICWQARSQVCTGFSSTTTDTTTFIDNVSTTGGVANISNLGSGLSSGRYQDNFATSSVTSFADGSFSFSVGIQGGTVGCAIWVDWNGDFTFDTATEKVYNTTAYGNGPFTGTITVPNGTANGDYYMRIMIDWNDSNPDDNPCSFEFASGRGEVEDYKVTVADTPTDELDYYNLQWPANGTIAAGETFDVYAQAYEAGLTDVTTGQAPGIESWIGYSTTDTNPNGAEWTWVAANFNVETNNGNNDEYTLNLGSVIPASGTFYYASRWKLNGGLFTYGGILADGSNGGTWGENNNISGVLVVNPPANDECVDAISLTVNSDYSCTNVTAGTILGATDSGANDATCGGTPDDDVWYSFVATSTAHRVSLIDQTGSTVDMYMTFYDGTAGCGSLGGSVACSDPQTANLTGLTIGNTYYVQVYTYTATGGQTSAFNICVGTPPPPPANDTCEGALVLTESSDSSCDNAVTGTTVSANPSASGTCSTAGKDVWYAFTPTATGNYNFSVTEVTDYGFSSTYITLYSGECGTTTQVGTGCTTTSISNAPLTASTTYYVVVRTTSTTAGVDFSLCAYPSPPPPANDLCADAVSLACDETINGTTIAATGGSASSCVGSIGNDVWYQYTGNDSTVDLTVTSSTTAEEAQVEVYSSTDGTCAGFTLATCFESGGSGENPVLLSFNADAGTTYFIRVGNWINGNAGLDFSIAAACTPYPDCGDPTGLTASVTTSTADISWTAPVAGTPVGYNWEVQLDGVAQGTAGAVDSGTTATTSDTATGLTPQTAYDLFVQTDCGSDGTSAWTGPYSFTTAALPPANDDCLDAIALTPGLIYTDNPVDGTVLGATLNGETSGCGLNGPGVWYSVVVPADGDITIETGPDTATSTTGFDSVIEAFSGECGTLTSIECDDDDAATGNYSMLTLTDLTPGSTIYVRVWEYGGNESEPFSISAYSATLSVGDVEQNGFTYFPNPVKNTLNLKAQSAIQNVSIYNMLGQEVLRTSPNSLNSEVNMESMQTGAYFVKVTINDATETIRVIKQ